MTERGRPFWRGLPVDGLTREQLIEVVYQLLLPSPKSAEPDLVEEVIRMMRERSVLQKPGGPSDV